MDKKHHDITSFTDDQLSFLNNELRDLWDWVSHIGYVKVTTATATPTGGSHKEVRIQNDGTNQILWLNVGGTWYNVGSMLTLEDHDHSGDTGDGGQLDWDDVWSDAVHSHASDAEGGTLDWDNVWSDAVHSHQSDAEGGKLDHGLALNGLTDDDHTQYALLLGRSGGQVLIGGTASGDDLTLTSTSDATKGFVLINGDVGINESSPETDIELTGTAPYITIHNSTEEDIAGGRESKLVFKGEQSGGEETTLAKLEVSHSGALDDEKGQMVIKINDGNDGDTPTTVATINSGGDLTLATGSIFLTSGAEAIGIGTATPASSIEVFHTAPYIGLYNSTHENIAAGRQSRLIFKGEKLDGTAHVLAYLECSHEGTADDQKGIVMLYLNDGNDGGSPSKSFWFKSNGDIRVYNNVGIGAAISTPEASLDIKQDDAAVWVTNTDPSDADESRAVSILLRGTGSGFLYDNTLAIISATHDGTGSDEKGNLIFSTNDGNDGNGATERMRIDSAGLVTLVGDLAISDAGSVALSLTSSDDDATVTIQSHSGSGDVPSLVFKRSTTQRCSMYIDDGNNDTVILASGTVNIRPSLVVGTLTSPSSEFTVVTASGACDAYIYAAGTGGDGGNSQLEIKSNGRDAAIVLESHTDAGDNPMIKFYRGSGNLYATLQINDSNDLEIVDTNVQLNLHNSTTTDTDGGRASLLQFVGERSGGEVCTMATIQGSHDGASDDNKGDLIFSVNNGTTPTEVLRMDSAQLATFAGVVRADGGFSDGASAGIDTTFLDKDDNTITVSGGIITAKTAP